MAITGSNPVRTTYNLDPVAQLVEHRMSCSVISFLRQVKHSILLSSVGGSIPLRVPKIWSRTTYSGMDLLPFSCPITIANLIINRFKTDILLSFRALI